MKRKLLIPLLILVSLNTLADGTYKKRNNCFGFFSWRYKVTANAKKIGTEPDYYGGASSDGKCNSLAQCTATGTYNPWPNNNPQIVATVTSKIGPGVPGSVSTWVNLAHWNKFILGGDPLEMYPGYPVNAMFTAPAFDSSLTYTGYGSSVGTGDIIFDDRTHSIIIKGITGRLDVDIPNPADVYTTIKIWILDARRVTDEKDAKVLTSMQAMIINGQLVIQGGFSAPDFQQPQRGKSAYTISDVNKTIAIDSSISLDDIIVEVGSDAGLMREGMPAKYSPDFNTAQMKNIMNDMQAGALFNMKVVENPVKSTLSIHIGNGTSHYDAVNITVVSASGNTVKTLYSGKLPQKEQQYVSADVSALKPGLYYVTAITNNKDKFTCKFIKQE